MDIGMDSSYGRPAIDPPTQPSSMPSYHSQAISHSMMIR